MGTYFSLYMICKVCMFDLNSCSHYIVEYILLVYFCLGNKNWNGSLLQQLVLRNTVHVCGKYVNGSAWMCGLTAIPSGLNLKYVLFLFNPPPVLSDISR